MLLAIDSGNTNIVFAVFDDDGVIQGEWRSSTTSERTADEYGIWLIQLMEMANIVRTEIKDAIIASVVPATVFSLKTLCRTYFSCEPLIVADDNINLGLNVCVDKPEEVGDDRLVSALAAYEQFGGPLIVVDFGTATTFDVIGEGGNYQGGVIAPGVNLSLEALHRAAAKLPRVAIERPEKVVGQATVPAMQSGIFWGYISLIEGLVERISTEMGNTPKVIATGGLSPLFAEFTDAISESVPELTLRGLYSIYKRNIQE
jgi:type III pantothenate kinase